MRLYLENYILSRKKEVMGTLLSDPEANAINFSIGPRQKNNSNKQKPTTVRSKDIKQMFTAIEQRKKPSNTIVIG